MTAQVLQGARARYDGPETRRIVLEAALHVFSERGFDGASTRAIAAAAGIEQGLLGYYFTSKMALWQQVVEAYGRDGELRLRQQLTPDFASNPVGSARAALPAFLHSFADNPRLTRLMLQEFSVLSLRHDWVVENFGRPVWVLLEPLFDALREDGYLSGAAPALAYFSLIGSALITFGNPDLVASLAGEDAAQDGWVERAVEHMMRPILTRA